MKSVAKAAGTLGLVGFAAFGSQLAAAADDAFWYIGGSAGRSRAQIDEVRIVDQLTAQGVSTDTLNVDNRDNAYKLFGGYQFNKYYAVESGYFDLGQFGYTATTTPAGSRTGSIKLRGINFDVVGMLPVSEKFSVLGRLGVNYAQARDTYSSTGAVPAPTNSEPTNKEANYKAGLGLQYDLTKSLGLRAEAERYRINDAVGNKGDVNMFSLGLVYRFNQTKHAPGQESTPPAAAEEKPTQVVVPVAKMQQYCTILDIQFEIKQDEIQLEEKEKLAVVGTFMNKYPETTAVIEGHADNVGTSEFNMELSRNRAESVVKYLVETLHIAPGRLSAVGYGNTRPIADNSTREGQQANRRINAVIACARDIAGLKVAPARVTMALEMDFDPYKADIDSQYRDDLKGVANFMRENPAVTAVVEGHASKSVGKTELSAAQSMDISQRRAQKVLDYLADKEGISRSRLSTEAFGRTRRVSYGTSLEGQMENRRVNIIFNYPNRK
jgi:OOP family OmpA-OmpF porin